ncbi:ABC-type multidrug transport system fused ATPase/permease subunit [Pseudarthrobacter sulfonivorans]|nr:ABC-type multidrug transport system fused ATPase/permease subunit [Pseudarthrobacter sulfonivorans]
MQPFIQYSRQFTMPLAQLGSMANLLQSGVASAERVFSLLDEEEESAEPAASSGPVFGRGRLVFESVSFSYSPDKPLISSLSLVAEPGQTVAIVGHTGAGKTTLVNLMMRFYELDAGRITLDGVDVTSVAMRALLSHRTSFVIAHRLSTIRDADLILVMEAGQIVEQGRLASLLAAGGAYARLYEAQLAAPVAEVEGVACRTRGRAGSAGTPTMKNCE